MEKKMIAVICVLMLLISLLVSCGKKYPTITIKGNEYVLATDEEGNTMLSDDGELVIYPTDSNGKPYKGENGEYETNFVDFPDKIVNGNIYETPQFKITMPEEWTEGEEGYIKSGNESVIFEVCPTATLNEKYTVEKYIATQIEGLEMFIEAQPEYKDKLKYSVEQLENITENELPCFVVIMQEYDDTQKVVSEQYLYYIVDGDTLLEFSYICRDASLVGTFDAYQFIDENLILKT
ncbi:MAG: hypothetical protein ACI4K9_01685 [Candidatus Fimenecus sp.]